jgi:alkylation response protein AidB-like acyl-CoA dehydrogenase
VVRDTARGYAQDKLFPRVLMDNPKERFDRGIVSDMGALGMLGPAVPEDYGGAGLGLRSPLSTLPAGILSRRFRNAHHHCF